MIYFLDTSALQHAYIANAKTRGIRRTISDQRNTCFVAEATILEIASVFGRHCRKHSLTSSAFRKFDTAFWEHVGQRKLQVHRAGQREIWKARHLLEYSVDLNKRITTFDALIAASALECALQHSARVCFCVEDRKLYLLMKDLPAYKAALKFRYIGPPGA
jgi:hypothetical protein